MKHILIQRYIDNVFEMQTHSLSFAIHSLHCTQKEMKILIRILRDFFYYCIV